MFHGGTADEDKQRIMEEFRKPESKCRVLVATVAFGLGLDIQDIDIVVHWGLPSSIMEYWQEVKYLVFLV